MLADPLKLGLYILLFLPGFVFVQTCEHHLLRERKPQFEKTLEIVLWSAFIWLIAFGLPVWWPFAAQRNFMVDVLLNALGKSAVPSVSIGLKQPVAWFFLAVCGWAFVAANVWGYLRKTFYVDSLIRWTTGRDWYPSVAFRFFKESLDQVVEIRLQDRRYLGILSSAPDTKEDNYLMLTEVSLLPMPDSKRQETESKKRAPENLQLVNSLLVKVDDIREMRSLKPSILRRIETEHRRHNLTQLVISWLKQERT